jgi:hypothetical protein
LVAGAAGVKITGAHFDDRTASALLPGAGAAIIHLGERCSRALQQCN